MGYIILIKSEKMIRKKYRIPKRLHFGECENRKIMPLAKLFLDQSKEKTTIADVGCYKRPIIDWVSKVCDLENFIGVEVDEDAIKYLRDRNIDCLTPSQFSSAKPVDYVFGLEVIEHITASDSRLFLESCLSRCKKALFLTTPNFEGWDAADDSNIKTREEYKEMRYIPDHLKYFDAKSSNPHYHKQIMTVETISEHILDVLPENWDWIVYKAWKWKLVDESTKAVFSHYFKLHVAIWNREVFDVRGRCF